MNETTKRYLISSGVTFLTGFLGAIILSLQTLSVPDLLEAGALIGVLAAVLRAGLKGGIEALIAWLAKK